MTEIEVIEFLKGKYPSWGCDEDEYENAITAIQALEEIQQYRAIGTVKEIKIREAQFARLSEGYLNDLTLLREYQAIGTVEELKSLKESNLTALEMADMWCLLENLKKYSAIGTIDEFKALKEKQKYCLGYRSEDGIKSPQFD